MLTRQPPQSLQITGLGGFPEVEPGDSLIELILASLQDNQLELQDGDVLVLAQKIVSKAENRYAWLEQVSVTAEAEALARDVDKDPRLAALILEESREVLRKRPGVVIVEHRLGYVHANAGIDRSNIQSDDDNPRVLLLPEDSDRSAAELREAIRQRCGCDVYIIINDSAGRAWREGTVGMAIGTAGFAALEDLIGQQDMFGQPLQVTTVAVADELAAAASFVMGQADEAVPLVLVRGACLKPASSGSQVLIRDQQFDMFR